jgi:hypothetical protein
LRNVAFIWRAYLRLMTTDASTNPAPHPPQAASNEGPDADREVAAIGIRLLEDAYLAWAAAASESEQALHAWLEPVGSRRAMAYPVYRAALDREEAAALDLRRLSELAGRLVESRACA